MVRRLLIYLLITCPALSGADKTTDKMLEVLREIGGLQEQIKAFEKFVEGKFADVNQNMSDQARATSDQLQKTLAASAERQHKDQQDQQDQQLKTLAAVAALGAQFQDVISELSTTREAVNVMNAGFAKLSTQMSDLAALVKAAQPAKPDAAAAPPPEISATDLYSNAEGDRMGGNLALALQEYTQYADKFGDTAQAPDAQYYVGSIHYSNQEWDDAVKSFDVLLQAHPDSKRVPEALYYKADALNRLGRGTEAAQVLTDLRKRFPQHPMAKRNLTIKPPA